MARTKKINQFDLKGNLIKTFDSATHASQHTGIPKSSIYNCAAGRLKKAGGYKWVYVAAIKPEVLPKPVEFKPKPLKVKSTPVEPKEPKQEPKPPKTVKPKKPQDEARAMFFCQCCGGKTYPKYKCLVCEDCLKRTVVTRGTDGKLPDTFYIPVKKAVLAATVERALEKLGGE